MRGYTEFGSMYHSEQVCPGCQEHKKEHKSAYQRLKLYCKKKITIKSGRVLKARRGNEMETDFRELCRAYIRRITEKKMCKGHGSAK